jgi:hypothetical protein
MLAHAPAASASHAAAPAVTPPGGESNRIGRVFRIAISMAVGNRARRGDVRAFVR